MDYSYQANTDVGREDFPQTKKKKYMNNGTIAPGAAIPAAARRSRPSPLAGPSTSAARP